MAIQISSHVAIGVGVGTVVLTLLGALIFKKIRKQRIPTEWRRIGTLKEVYFYPLKSAKGIKRDQLFCTTKGFTESDKSDKTIELRDRSFLIYTSKDKEVRTARQLPRSFLIEIRAAENAVILSAPNQRDLRVPIPKVKNDQVAYFGKEGFTGTDCGDEAAKWLSNFLLEKDEGLRLAYGDGNQYRNLLKYHPKFAQAYPLLDNELGGIFSDMAAIHLVNQASVDDVNQKLPEDEKITFIRFRPNLLIEGPEAYEEHKWSYLKLGEVVLKACLEVPRCIETTVRLDGTRSEARQPLKTLEDYPKTQGRIKNSGIMGIYLKVLKTGKITNGDAIYVSKDE